MIENHGDNGGGLSLGCDLSPIDAKEIVLSNSIITGNTGKYVPNFEAQTFTGQKIERLNVYNCILDDDGTTFQPGRLPAGSHEQDNRRFALDGVKLGVLSDFGNSVPVRPLLEGSPANLPL